MSQAAPINSSAPPGTTTKGILLAGGTGTRLHPLTRAVSKQLLPVYDKPMIYYPLSVLMLAEIRHVLLIATPQHLPQFECLLGDGHWLGMQIEYAVQPEPAGIAHAFHIAAPFVNHSPSALVLGDNLFFGQGFQTLLMQAKSRSMGATVFGYPVKDPQRYGVVEFDNQGKPLSIAEKPSQPRSNLAIVGLYFFDHQAVEIASQLKPSARGELEITDMLRHYLQRDQLIVERFSRGFAWLDAGTHESLIQAGQFVQTLETRQGLRIACLEEIAFRKGWIDRAQLLALSENIHNEYGHYLTLLAEM